MHQAAGKFSPSGARRGRGPPIDLPPCCSGHISTCCSQHPRAGRRVTGTLCEGNGYGRHKSACTLWYRDGVPLEIVRRVAFSVVETRLVRMCLRVMSKL